MKWQEMIEMGMKLIADGCQRNTEWRKCEECPFDNYCSTLYEEHGTPGEWEGND